MLEGIAALILQKSLGWLVDGLDSKNFNVSLWSGEVVLNNLAVKADALDGLGLPIAVKSGQLRSLRLKIPWRSLSTQQTVIEISGLDILAIPQNEFPKEDQEKQKDAAVVKKRTAIVAQEKLRLERKEGKDKGVTAGEAPGRVASMITSIVDNCRVEISGIHIRIEDKSSSELPFAFGIKLGAIALESVNKLFEISRDVTNKIRDVGIIRKALQMKDLCIYLDPLQPSQPTNDHHVHILPPVCLGIQVTFDDTMVGGNGPKIEDATTPVLGLDVSLPSLGVTVSKSQYCNVINLTSFVSNFSLRFENRQHRPKESVTNNPRAWWRYAISSIRDDVRKRLERVSWKNMMHKHMLHKRYIKQWKLKDAEYAKKMKLKVFKPDKHPKDAVLLIALQ